MNKFFKLFLIILAILWACLFTLLGILMLLDTPRTMEHHKKFVDECFVPEVKFIKDFIKTNNRIPTKREYYSRDSNWRNTFSVDTSDSLISSNSDDYIRYPNDILGGDESYFKDMVWGKDFAIGVWNGDENEYYFSLTDSYPKGYGWSDAYITLAFCSVIGFLPLVVCIFVYRKKRKKTLLSEAK